MNIKTRIFKCFITALLLPIIIAVFQASPANAFDTNKFSLAFGTAENQVMYYNKTVKGFQDIYASGPACFALIDGKIAILDCFNNAIKIFDESGKISENIDLASATKTKWKPNLKLFVAMAARKTPQGLEFNVADSSGVIYRIAGGELVKKIVNKSKKGAGFGQIGRMHVFFSGDLLVSDSMSEKTMMISEDGDIVRSFKQSRGEFFASDDGVYVLKYHYPVGTFVLYKKTLNFDKSEVLFKLQNTQWRFGNLVAVDRDGNAIIWVCDDSIQKTMRDEKLSFNGFLTLMVVSRNGRILSSQNIPVTSPDGGQFFYDEKSGDLYYQNFNANLAPAGKYGIVKVDLKKAAAKKGTAPAEAAAGKDNVLKIARAGGKTAMPGEYPVMKSDAAGNVYLLDRAVRKVHCVSPAMKPAGVIDAAKAAGPTAIFDDFFAVSSSEIYLLDSKNSVYYKITVSKGVSTSKSFDYKKTGLDEIDAIFANARGNVALYSSVNASLSFFDSKGVLKNTQKKVSACSYFFSPASGIAAMTANKKSGFASVDFFDFMLAPANKKGADAVKMCEKTISAASIVGADQKHNAYITYFDGAEQKIAVIGASGRKLSEASAPVKNDGFCPMKSVCAANGAVYFGSAGPGEFVVRKVTLKY